MSPQEQAERDALKQALETLVWIASFPPSEPLPVIVTRPSTTLLRGSDEPLWKLYAA